MTSSLLLLFRDRMGGSAAPAELDLTSLGSASAIYSVMKTKGWAGNCLRVKRLSDNAQLDIGFGTDGFVDMAAAEAHRGTSTNVVVKWYDQSGNGFDATTASNSVVLSPTNAVYGKQPITMWGASMLIPDACVTSRQLVSYITVNNILTVGSNSIVDKGKSDATRLSLLQGYTGVKSVLNTASFLTTSLAPRTQPELSVLTSSNSASLIYQDNSVSSTLAASTDATQVGGFINSNNTPYTGYGDMFFVAVYPKVISSAEVSSLRSSFYSYFGIQTTLTKKVVFDGDSITQGTGVRSTDSRNNPRQVEQLLSERIYSANYGVFGQSLATMYTNRTWTIGGAYGSLLDANILVTAGGTNDIAAGTTAVNLFNNSFVPYVSFAKTIGYKVIAGTLINRSWAAGYEAERVAYNQLIRDNAATYGYTVCDYAADVVATGDGTHPTVEGYGVMAARLAPILEDKLSTPNAALSSPVDLTLAVLPDWSSFTRSTTSYLVGSSGIFKTYSSYKPKFKYNTSSACVGLVLEPAITVFFYKKADSVFVSKNKCTASTSAADPMGGTTGVLLTEDGTTGTHSVLSYSSLVSSKQYTLMCCFEDNGVGHVRLFVRLNGTSYAVANVDLITGVITNSGTDGTKLTLDAAGIEDIGGGWYKAYITVTTGTSITATEFGFVLNRINDTSTTTSDVSYAGDSTSGVYTFGFSIIEGSNKELVTANAGADSLSVVLPSDVVNMRFTFDDASTQTVDVSAYSGGLYTIPTNLNRRIITLIEPLTS